MDRIKLPLIEGAIDWFNFRNTFLDWIKKNPKGTVSQLRKAVTKARSEFAHKSQSISTIAELSIKDYQRLWVTPTIQNAWEVFSWSGKYKKRYEIQEDLATLLELCDSLDAFLYQLELHSDGDHKLTAMPTELQPHFEGENFADFQIAQELDEQVEEWRYFVRLNDEHEERGGTRGPEPDEPALEFTFAVPVKVGENFDPLEKLRSALALYWGAKLEEVEPSHCLLDENGKAVESDDERFDKWASGDESDGLKEGVCLFSPFYHGELLVSDDIHDEYREFQSSVINIDGYRVSTEHCIEIPVVCSRPIDKWELRTLENFGNTTSNDFPAFTVGPPLRSYLMFMLGSEMFSNDWGHHAAFDWSDDWSGLVRSLFDIATIKVSSQSVGMSKVGDLDSVVSSITLQLTRATGHCYKELRYNSGRRTSIGKMYEMDGIIPSRAEMFGDRTVRGQGIAGEFDPRIKGVESDVLEYYQNAFLCADVASCYLALYHVLEFFFESEEVVAQREIRNTISRHKDDPSSEEAIMELSRVATGIEKVRERDELRKVIEKYCQRDLLLKRIHPFVGCKAEVCPLSFITDERKQRQTTVRWFGNKAEAFVSGLAERIYQTRNYVVHRKRPELDRFRLDKSAELEDEVLLIRAVAETVLFSACSLDE